MRVLDPVKIDTKKYPHYWRHRNRVLTLKKLSLDKSQALLEWYEPLPSYEKRTDRLRSNYAIFWCPVEAIIPPE